MQLIHRVLLGISFPIFFSTGLMVVNPELTHIAITRDVALVLFPMSFTFILMVGLDYLIRYRIKESNGFHCGCCGKWINKSSKDEWGICDDCKEEY